MMSRRISDRGIAASLRCTRLHAAKAWDIYDSTGRRIEPEPAMLEALQPVMEPDATQQFSAHQAVEAILVARGDGYVLHSTTEPALRTAKGSKFWFRWGLLHRDDDLPAVEEFNGSRTWCRDGRTWRADGQPAYAAYDATLAWYDDDGQLHRENGPAEIQVDEVAFYLHGIVYAESMNKLIQQLAEGGLVPRIVQRDQDCTWATYVLETPRGEAVGDPQRIPSAGWISWILEQAPERYPELAAALRARAMRNALDSAARAAAPSRDAPTQHRLDSKARI